MTYDLALNFLPLNASTFTFSIYCKKAKEDEKRWNNEIHNYRIKDKSNTYSQYWVSFNPLSDFELRECQSNDNYFLTIQFLFELLSRQVNQERIPIHSKINRFNVKRLYLTSERVYDGNKKFIGAKTIWVEPYYLKVNQKFGFLVDYSFLKDISYPFNREVQKFSLSLNSDYRSNVNYNIDKYQSIQLFVKNILPKIASLNDLISISSSFQNIEADTLNIKNYIFGKLKQDKSQFNGLMKNGPYEEVTAVPFYFYIFKQEHKNYSTDLLNALNGKTYNTFKGLATFKLSNQTKTNTIGVVIKDYSSTEIENIINKVKEVSNENSIIISVSPENEEIFYYELKNRCLQENIPSQNVHIETVNNNNTLKWSIGSIALQIFSKLGGVPWIVEPSHENTLIVGIGQSNKYNEITGEIERYFSYSVLVDSSGKFVEIKQLADENDKRRFLIEISENICALIKEHKEYKKIVFHIPQKIKKDEIQYIQKALESFESNVELSIIKINDDPKFNAFNKSENTLVPYESSVLKLSENEYLLWSEGLNFHNKKALKRYGNPLHITFFYSNNETDFKNHKKYLQDILNLSGANYRGFNAKSLPVSIYYPKLIADFTRHFKELNLSLSSTNTKKPWFL